MASGSSEHHMDRLGRHLGDRFCSSFLAPEEWIALLPRGARRFQLALPRCGGRLGLYPASLVVSGSAALRLGKL